MGLRGPGAARYYAMQGHELYDELVRGVGNPTPYELDVIRRRWKHRGAREEIMRTWNEPGRRPWAFWRFDVTKAERGDVAHLKTEAEKLIALGKCSEEEQAAIIDLNVVEEQQKELADEPATDPEPAAPLPD